MLNKELRESLSSLYPDTIILEDPNFDNSIIGVSVDGNLIYDIEKMIQELMSDDEMSEADARDFIDHSTLRALSYMGEQCPIIMDSNLMITFEDEK